MAKESAGKEKNAPIPMQVGALKRATPKRATTHTLTTNSTKSVFTNTNALAFCECISEREREHAHHDAALARHDSKCF